MNWTIELILMPVSDVDRAKAFYVDKAGFNEDVDFSAGDFRIVQLTPLGSACSITLMKNEDAAGTLQGIHIIVPDIESARATLLERGMEVSELYHFERGGPQRAGPAPDRGDYETYMSFADPDGNGWVVQEVPSRAVS
jgi:catechol 2,3-dioxygenase-like lactoylglutathione lyase family enzyme